MMFVSTSSKMSHQSTPSASPVRSARPAVMSLSLCSAPKMRPNTPPSTMSRKKPAQRLSVGSASAIPNQCKAAGNPFPGAPTVTKSNMASTRLAKIPARSPLRSGCIVLLSLSLHKPARDARPSMALRCRLQTRREPIIDAQPAPGRNSHQEECQQDQHAIRPDPFTRRVGQPNIQLQRENRRKYGSKTRKESEQQADGYQQLSRPDAGCQGHKCRTASRRRQTGAARKKGMLEERAIPGDDGVL